MKHFITLFFLFPISVDLAYGTQTPQIPQQPWSFQGLQGTYDKASLQRGFQVYQEVCAACHSLKLIHFRHLQALGFNADQIKALAAAVQVVDGPNEEGEMFERKGLPSDPLPSPFKNEKAARAANGGAFPPDLSLITKARKNGPDYLYALLTGYATPPTGMNLGQGMSFNLYFPGHQIAMPPPLTEEGQVKFSDGTRSTVSQMAHDLVTFLAWAAEPELEMRKALGVRVLFFVGIFTGLMFFVMRRAWRQSTPR